MRLRFGLAVAMWCGLAGGVFAQSTAAQSTSLKPLQAMPYSPSLNVADMDKSVDPCVDFYQYSCGGWIKSNPIPADQAAWSVYGKLAQDNLQFLWGILVDASKATNRTPSEQKVGDYFGACMDEDSINKRGLAPLKPLLTRIDGLKTREELVAYLPALHHEQVGNFFFGSGSGQDLGDSSQVIAFIAAGGLGLPDRDYYTKTDAKSEETRAKYVAYIAQQLTLAGEPKATAEADAAAIMKIETTLAKASLTRVERRDPYKEYHKMSVEDLGKLTPSIDWNRYFVAQNVPGVKSLNVNQPDFQKALQTELTAEPLPALKAYLRFHAITAAASSLSKDFDEAQFNFYSKYLRGVQQQQPRWKRCTRQVDNMLGEALGQEFVRRTFGPDTKAKTVKMTDEVEQAMAGEIKGLSWMGDATKQRAIEKLHMVRNKIGYPDTWRDYSKLEVKADDYFDNMLRASLFEDQRQWAKVGKPVDKNEWDMTPPTVNAYYNPQMNDINFPAGVLQPPLYDAKLDDAPNYGNTGSTIGHELTHAFDDEGRQFDGAGNLKDWWTKEDAEGFEKQINCLRDQFATYTIVDDIKINSKLTSGEDVADLGGTLIAYIAWKKATENQRLAPVEGFTPDQRFFIGFAQWACENQRPENLRVSAITNPHSPGYARINGIVTNMPEFATAFGCKKGQPMVKEAVCKVW
ncbi:M13 family metallopeptidase [Terriglobus albidus]|uniref:M13 family metallopeptidase n=1 Tax=Terriglobus albidus TaxID=1592106 RepID=A0A5B9EHG4_9BACT|nr:M13 family metallopeptidase [Terriglobus albidus]QEE29506.1 M13 family metallopeptidase [Terriglobus albidus]